MTRAMLVAVLILFSISSVNLVDCLIQDSLGRFLGTFATVKQVKIPYLLNQVCDDSQGSNTTRRDACYGCFYRASVLPQDFSMLVAMSMCADSYLNNTSYGHCQAYLRNVTSTPNMRSPRLIYCSFLECIRQVNKDTLIVDVRGPSRSSRSALWRIKQQKSFLFSKIVVPRNSVCIIRQTNAVANTATTVRTLPINPRSGKQQPLHS
ncbi:uncharacterized protein [Linepithema humile]|uniref:uncharacterized protein isoform X1 n=1 Tax=Linepithema humile TaxID=83485 RepID=UPI0006238D76|nr:PREDICTED: uncharacterized protein LOC105672858 [Linepithema humile]